MAKPFNPPLAIVVVVLYELDATFTGHVKSSFVTTSQKYASPKLFHNPELRYSLCSLCLYESLDEENHSIAVKAFQNSI